MLGAIKYNLSNLTNGSGRDARQTFWFYVLFLFIVQYIVGVLISFPMMGQMMGSAYQGVRDGLSDAEMEARILASVRGPMRTMMLLSASVSLVACLMVVAAFVRRLHDSDKPGWIAGLAFALVLAAQAINIANMDRILTAVASVQAGDFAAMADAQQTIFGGAALGWLGYLMVIVFGVWPSTEGPNRYGEASVRF